MGEDIRFARNSQKNIRELIRKQEMAQTELATVLTELHGDVAAITPKNKNLLKKLNTASFAMRELQNNWNSLEFAFQHLMVPQVSTNQITQNNSQNPDPSKRLLTNSSQLKNENNNIHSKPKTSPVEVKKEPKIEPEEESEEEESEVETEFVSRRSPRIRQNSVRTDSGRSTPIKEKPSKVKNNRKRKSSKSSEEKKLSQSQSEPNLIPKRESLRRVLELSKRTYERTRDENDKSDDETADNTANNSDISDGNDSSDSDNELGDEQNELKTTSDEQETPKINLKAALSTPRPNNDIPTDDNKEDEFPKRKLKTDPKILARQRELYHKRKQRRQSNEIITSGSEASGNVGLSKPPVQENGTQPEKGKPWCNVPDRKTPSYILQRRKEAYYRRKEQKLFEANKSSNSNTQNPTPKEVPEKKKSLKKIEAKPKPQNLNGAITPIKPIASFVKMTIIPPVYNTSQLETLKSLDQLNQPGLVLLPSPQPQLLNGKKNAERNYVKIEKSPKVNNIISESDRKDKRPDPPKKRKWDDRTKEVISTPPDLNNFTIGSTNGQLPCNGPDKEKHSTPNSATVPLPTSGYFKKKIAANWERSLSNSSDTDKDSKIYHPVNPHSSEKKISPKRDPLVTSRDPPRDSKSPSVNHILKNRLTATSEHTPPVSVE